MSYDNDRFFENLMGTEAGQRLYGATKSLVNTMFEGLSDYEIAKSMLPKKGNYRDGAYNSMQDIKDEIDNCQRDIQMVKAEADTARKPGVRYAEILSRLYSRESSLKAELQDRIEERRDPAAYAEQKRMERYNSLYEQSKTATSEWELKRLVEQLRELDGFEDSEDLADEIEQRYENLKSTRISSSYSSEIQKLSELKKQFDSRNKLTPHQLRELANSYKERARQFNDLEGYKSSVEKAKECERNSDTASKLADTKERRAIIARKTVIGVGIGVQVCVTAYFLYTLYGTAAIRQFTEAEKGSWGIMHSLFMPLCLFGLTLACNSMIFFRKNFISGALTHLPLFGVAIVYAVTLANWTDSASSDLLTFGLLCLVAIIPGFILLLLMQKTYSIKSIPISLILVAAVVIGGRYGFPALETFMQSLPEIGIG
ncbi:MAG: hypothetical protein FWG31_00810 [Oscillospiraceae bacterium]|nr:hypothetical protein [Oscillospiraceae bacterium]